MNNDKKVKALVVSKVKTIAIRISEKEAEMVNNMVEVCGSGMSELIRGLIRNKYEKMFPYYKVKGIPMRSKEPELTKEQICEMNGGKVISKNGELFCQYTNYNGLDKKHYVSGETPIALVELDDDE